MSAPKQNIMYSRNPVYVFYTLGGLILLLITGLIARHPGIGQLERSMFNLLYYLPQFLTPLAILVTALGSIFIALLISLILLLRQRRDIAWRLIVASVLAFILATLSKGLLDRGRPDVILDYVVPKITATGFGFPSTYAAVSIAVGLTLALYIPRIYRKWITLIVILVGCSQLYLGVNLPLDVIGGWAIGLVCFSLTSLALGSIHVLIDAEKLASKLRAAGLEVIRLKPASVDARGSVPFFGEAEQGKIFVKVFNQDNNAADWLFKLVRRIQYRRLEDEVPSLTPKRAIEHEAYLTMLAKYGAKVRVPEMLGIYKVGSNSYAMATLRLDATGLDKLEDKKFSDKLLDRVWKQIVILHQHNIIHKDLRTANVMVENKHNGAPWLIDFGFSECAVDASAYYKDNVEFIASSATKVGAQRAVRAAYKALGRENIAKALPYMQYAALSGATTTYLKQHPQLIHEIRQEMLAATHLGTKKIRPARLRRIRSVKSIK